MSSVGVWIRRGVIGAAIAALSAIATASYMQLLPQTTPLTEKVTPATNEFDGRLKAMFQTGSDATNMVTKLHEAGFAPIAWPDSPDSDREAMRSEFQIPCRKDFFVRWRVDKQGKLASIGGLVMQTCP